MVELNLKYWCKECTCKFLIKFTGIFIILFFLCHILTGENLHWTKQAYSKPSYVIYSKLNFDFGLFNAFAR